MAYQGLDLKETLLIRLGWAEAAFFLDCAIEDFAVAFLDMVPPE
jgi:hypothetical protein